MSRQIPSSELILNEDGSIYHLALQPHELADTLILVGDPDRVPLVSSYFDTIQFKQSKREFITHTGLLNNTPISVLSTGIGTDNMDIVLNEINLLKNADLQNRVWLENKAQVNLIRFGTAGSTGHHEIDSILLSEAAIGIDGLAWHYGLEEKAEYQKLTKMTDWSTYLPTPYQVTASPELLSYFSALGDSGLTLTATGFYQPQGRVLNPKITPQYTIQQLHDIGIANIEMETAGLYLLSKVFGFRALSISLLLADRLNHTFSSSPEESMKVSLKAFMEIVADFIQKSDSSAV